MMIFVILVLTGVSGNEITLNTNEITIMRDATNDDGKHVADGVGCMIHTTDGKFTTVTQTCAEIRKRISEGK